MKKTLVIFFVCICLLPFSSFGKGAPNQTMHFIINNANGLKDDLIKIIQLQYYNLGDTIPIDSIYDGHANTTQKLTNNWPKECQSSTPIYSQYQRLMFVYKNDTLYSEMFNCSSSHSIYQLDFANDVVNVKDITPWFFRDDSPNYIYRAIIITLIFETLGLWLVLLLFKYPDKKRFIIGILLANIISLPIYYVGLLPLLGSTVGFFVGILFSVFVEAFFIWTFTKKAGTFGKMLMLSFFLNFLSTMAGGVFMFLNAIYGNEMINWFI